MLVWISCFITFLVATVTCDNRSSICQPVGGSLYDYQVETLDKQNVTLDAYQGRVLLIVNVATYCAYTEQYLDFNPLMQRYANSGVTLLLFPCNQFALQEPGNNDELLNGLQYVRPGKGWKPSPNVHLFGKLDVNGNKAHPMYEYLRTSCPPTIDTLGKKENMYWTPIKTNDIVWNFEKFLVDHRGQPRYRFHPENWQNGTMVEPYLRQLLAEANANNVRYTEHAQPQPASTTNTENSGDSAAAYRLFMNFINAFKLLQDRS